MASSEYLTDQEFLKQIDKITEILPNQDQKLDNSTLICECFCVSVEDIRQVCREQVDLELLREKYQFGGGCQSCLRRKDDWFDRIL